MSTPSGEPPQDPQQPGGQNWQLPQPDYGQQGYVQPIPNHLVWSILTTIFCCQPFGIVSIVYAAQVDSKRAGGDIRGALDASRKAKSWAIAAAVTGPALVMLLVAFSLAVGTATGPTGDFPW